MHLDEKHSLVSKVLLIWNIDLLRLVYYNETTLDGIMNERMWDRMKTLFKAASTKNGKRSNRMYETVEVVRQSVASEDAYNDLTKFCSGEPLHREMQQTFPAVSLGHQCL